MAVIESVALIVTAVATSLGAIIAWRGFHRMGNKEKPVLDFLIKGLGNADNVLKGQLTVRNHGSTKIIVRRIRLLKPKFSENKMPRVGLGSVDNLNDTVLPKKELEEPFELDPGQEGNKKLFLYLYLRSGNPLKVKLGVDIEYIGTKIKKETLPINRPIQMPGARTNS